jgi:hypothetical protein
MNRIVMLRFKSTHLAGCEPGLKIKTNLPLRPRRVRRIYFIRLQRLSIVDRLIRRGPEIDKNAAAAANPSGAASAESP